MRVIVDERRNVLVADQAERLWLAKAELVAALGACHKAGVFE